MPVGIRSGCIMRSVRVRAKAELSCFIVLVLK